MTELSKKIDKEIQEIFKKKGFPTPDFTEIMDKIEQRVLLRLPAFLGQIFIEVLLEESKKVAKDLGQEEPCQHWQHLHCRLTGKRCQPIGCKDYTPSKREREDG